MKSLLLGAVALATACTLFNPQSAQAWHKEGHMTVALIAYRQLDEMDQSKVREALKKHPHYDLFLSAEFPADANLDEWVVMRAAIWPDWVKNPSSAGKNRGKIKAQFSHSDWHFVNKPIIDLTDASAEDKKAIETNSAKEGGLVLQVLPQLIDGFKDENDVDLVKLVWANKQAQPTLTPDQAKAIALCWILHLVGDIHQPLHAATLFTKDALKGDNGGNGLIVRWENHPVDLHSIWDGRFGWDKLKGPQDSEYGVVDTLARDLSARIKPTMQERTELKQTVWASESVELAKTKAYFVHGKLIPGVFVSFQEHRPPVSDLDPLPAGYAKRVQTIAEQRVTLAGYRMGTLLQDLIP